MAARDGYRVLVERLLEYGAQVDLQDDVSELAMSRVT